MPRSQLARRFGHVAGLVSLLLTSTRTIAHAQACVGDCDGSAKVAINELVLGANILLGLAGLERCPGFDNNRDGRVVVNELVRAVADLLYGCGVTPPTPRPTDTPTFTPTATATPTPSPTATPTSGFRDISGIWHEDMPMFVSSTCDPRLDDQFRQQIAAAPPSDYTVAQQDADLSVADSTGGSESGELDLSGTMRLHGSPASQTQNGCTVSARDELVGDMTHSPTTIHGTVAVTFAGTCRQPPCMVLFTTRWTRR